MSHGQTAAASSASYSRRLALYSLAGALGPIPLHTVSVSPEIHITGVSSTDLFIRSPLVSFLARLAATDSSSLWCSPGKAYSGHTGTTGSTVLLGRTEMSAGAEATKREALRLYRTAQRAALVNIVTRDRPSRLLDVRERR